MNEEMGEVIAGCGCLVVLGAVVFWMWLLSVVITSALLGL